MYVVHSLCYQFTARWKTNAVLVSLLTDPSAACQISQSNYWHVSIIGPQYKSQFLLSKFHFYVFIFEVFEAPQRADVRFTTSNHHIKHHCSTHAQTDQKNNGTLSFLNWTSYVWRSQINLLWVLSCLWEPMNDIPNVLCIVGWLECRTLFCFAPCTKRLRQDRCLKNTNSMAKKMTSSCEDLSCLKSLRYYSEAVGFLSVFIQLYHY